jgi:hypothetical protein
MHIIMHIILISFIVALFVLSVVVAIKNLESGFAQFLIVINMIVAMIGEMFLILGMDMDPTISATPGAGLIHASSIPKTNLLINTLFISSPTIVLFLIGEVKAWLAARRERIHQSSHSNW